MNEQDAVWGVVRKGHRMRSAARLTQGVSDIEEESNKYIEEEEESSSVMDNTEPEESKEKNIVLTLKKKS